MLFNRVYQYLVTIPLKLLVSSKILPDEPVKELDIDLERPIYYVIQRRSVSSYLMLRENTKKLGLPTPKLIRSNNPEIENGSVFFLQEKYAILSANFGSTLVSAKSLIFKIWLNIFRKI